MINENPNFNQPAQWMLITLIRAGSITRTEDTITPLLKMNHKKGQVALLQSGVVFKSDASVWLKSQVLHKDRWFLCTNLIQVMMPWPWSSYMGDWPSPDTPDTPNGCPAMYATVLERSLLTKGWSSVNRGDTTPLWNLESSRTLGELSHATYIIFCSSFAIWPWVGNFTVETPYSWVAKRRFPVHASFNLHTDIVWLQNCLALVSFAPHLYLLSNARTNVRSSSASKLCQLFWCNWAVAAIHPC